VTEQILITHDRASGSRVADAMVTSPKTHALESAPNQIHALFDDDHVHMALIVAPDKRLITTIERSDLTTAASASPPIRELGTLVGRTVGPSDILEAVSMAMLRERRRRMAVIDDSGRLLGLLCLKRDGTGYCSDESIRQRAAQVNRFEEVRLIRREAID
jgi:CBS domain-containing protein